MPQIDDLTFTELDALDFDEFNEYYYRKGDPVTSIILAPQEPVTVEGEVNNFAVSFADILDDDESLTGTPTVEEVTTSDLTIGDSLKQVNTSVLVINEKSVAIGKAVQFDVSGQLVDNSPYTIKITVTTDATPAQTKIRYVRFSVETIS